MSDENSRWEKVRALDKQLFADFDKVKIGDSDLQIFSRRREIYEALVRVLDSISEDATLPQCDRDTAETRLVVLRRLARLFSPPPLTHDAVCARMHRGEAAQTAAEIAADENVDEVTRREASRILKELSDQLRSEGSDVSKWISAPSNQKH